MSTEPGLIRKSSKALHKWIGLLGFLWLAVMGATGIILNHPGAISGIDLPRKLLPGDYEYRDWNRNAFRGAVEHPGGGLLLYGEAGVWRFSGDSSPPVDFSAGLPEAAYLRDTRDLIDAGNLYLCATRGGLYARGKGESAWRKIPLADEYPVDLFTGRDSIYALTRSDLFAAPLESPESFKKVTPAREFPPGKRSLFRLVFDMHYGETWGWPGRYLMDLAGLYLVFGSLTGAWFWWRKKRKKLAKGRGGELARKGLRLHIRLGLWAAPLLVFTALTGIFERPPFLVAIADAEYPLYLHPGPRPENPWRDTLRKGLFDPARNTVVLATSEGFFEGDAGRINAGEGSLRMVPGGAPVSVMGATVFETDPASPFSSTYFVGSMSGLFEWDRGSGRVQNSFTGEAPEEPKGPPVGDHMVVGFHNLDETGRFLWADYNRGLFFGDGRAAHAPLPLELKGGGRISLWHALFEVHNGRIFGFILGWWSWIVVPLTGLCLVLETVTGVYDRLKAKKD